MIQPEEIRRKAENLYPLFLRSWLDGRSFFPRPIPCRKDIAENLAAAIESVNRLRSDSKELRGIGYTVEWIERNSRKHGRNKFPSRILFETQDDFLRYIGKQRQFTNFANSVERIRSFFPVLRDWIASHRQLVIDAANDIEGLLEVVLYFEAHPRPALFARELPLLVDTKFVERNARILREWLDLILPPYAIRADELHFARRYGLNYDAPLIRIRFLDPAIRRLFESPWIQCAVPLHVLGDMDVDPVRVLIVENKVNLLTLPPFLGTIGLGGLGDGATDFRYLPWLRKGELLYWGDIDAEGFAILGRLRALFPHIQSLLMDVDHVLAWRKPLGRQGTGRPLPAPANLTEAERAAFEICMSENLRIEQERIPHAYVVEYLSRLFGSEPEFAPKTC